MKISTGLIALLCLCTAARSFAQQPSSSQSATVPDPPPPLQDSRGNVQPGSAQPAGSVDVYFYPKENQPPQRQARDKYECYLWARKQTGYDPSVLHPDSRGTVRVVAVPGPGHDTAVGTVAGAVVGASVARPRDAGAGALIGAVAGAVLGAASDESRRRQASEEQARIQRARDDRAARADLDAQGYRRALKACLEGRGYSVQ